jgi:hypothetical protein
MGLEHLSTDSGGLRLLRAGPSRTRIKTRSVNRMTRPGQAVVMPARICASWRVPVTARNCLIRLPRRAKDVVTGLSLFPARRGRGPLAEIQFAAGAEV